MLYRLSKRTALFSLLALLFCVAAMPIFAQTTTATSDGVPCQPTAQKSTTDAKSDSNCSGSWTPGNWIALVTAIGSIIVSVFGASKGTNAQKTADGNTNRLNAHDQQITSLAQNQMPAELLSRLVAKE